MKALRRTGDRELFDDRILGSGDFVERIIKEADVKVRYQFAVKEHTEELNDFIDKICRSEKVTIKELKSGSRRQEVSKARALISIGLVKNYGVSLAEVARRLNISTSAVSKIIRRSNQ